VDEEEAVIFLKSIDFFLNNSAKGFVV